MADIFAIDDKIFSLMLSWEEIEFRVQALANQINKDYSGKEPLFLVAMKGAIFFAVELMKNISVVCSMDCIFAKSYRGMEQIYAGKVEVLHNNLVLAGKDIIIVEDIIDTGHTITKLLEVVNNLHPASVAVATLFNKPMKHLVDVIPNYVGFNIPPNFIIGFGLDYNQKGRNLKGIYTVVE